MEERFIYTGRPEPDERAKELVRQLEQAREEKWPIERLKPLMKEAKTFERQSQVSSDRVGGAFEAVIQSLCGLDTD